MKRIGLSSCFFHADPKRAIFKGKTLLYMEQSMVNWVQAVGVLTYLIPQPVTGGPSISQIVSDLDGLVLEGGSDISPKNYGEEPLKPEWAGDYIRDLYEIALVKEFMAQKKPILGICRGAQLINVALGGTMYQDITTQVPGSLVHRDWEIYDQNFHEIEIVAGSRLSMIYGGRTKGKTNTIHHQGLKDLAPGLIIEAYSLPDRQVEAIRYTGDSYVFGVQWHPEFQDRNDPSLLSNEPIIQDFLAHT